MALAVAPFFQKNGKCGIHSDFSKIRLYDFVVEFMSVSGLENHITNESLAMT